MESSLHQKRPADQINKEQNRSENWRLAIPIDIDNGGKTPVFLASSFAFIAPITFGVQEFGLPATLSGLAAAGLLYLALSLLIF